MDVFNLGIFIMRKGRYLTHSLDLCRYTKITTTCTKNKAIIQAKFDYTIIMHRHRMVSCYDYRYRTGVIIRFTDQTLQLP